MHLAVFTIFHFRHNLEVTSPSLNVSEELKSLGVLSVKTNQTFTLVKNDDIEATTLRAAVRDGLAQIKCCDWISAIGIKTR